MYRAGVTLLTSTGANMKNNSNSRFPPPGFVRLTLNIPEGLRKRLHLASAKRGISIAAIIVESLKAAGIK